MFFQHFAECRFEVEAGRKSADTGVTRFGSAQMGEFSKRRDHICREAGRIVSA